MKRRSTISKVRYLQEVKYSNIEYDDIYSSPIFLEVNNDLSREESSWNVILRTVDNLQNIETIIKSFIDEIENRNSVYIKDDYTDFLKKISYKYKEYILEASQKKENEFHEISVNSLIQVIRFIPEFPKQDLDIYIDERTGCFGVIIQPKIKAKPLLNLLMQDNKEIIFSYIKKRKKIIKISGRAYFNDEYEDSCEMSKLIRIIIDQK